MFVIFSLLTSLLSVWMTAYLTAVLTHHYTDGYKLAVMRSVVMEYGFKSNIFLPLFALTEALAAYITYLWYCDVRDKDVMGRHFRTVHNNETYGNAHFAQPSEYSDYAKVNNQHDAYGIILGQLDMTGRKLVNYNMSPSNQLNRNMCITGPSGSGKTFCISKPYIYQAVKRRESLIITDPDQGLYRDMSEYLIAHGYKVRWFNLASPERSDRWNPLDDIKIGDMQITCSIIATVIVQNTVENLGYRGVATQLLNAAMLWVMGQDDDKINENYPKNLTGVYNFLNVEGVKSSANGQNQTKINAFSKLANRFKSGQEPYQKKAEELFRVLQNSSENFGGNTLTEVVSNLKVMANDTISAITDKSDMSVLDLGNEPCAYFCSFPDTHATYQFFVSLFFSVAMIQLCTYADFKCPDGRLKVPVTFLLEEAGVFEVVGLPKDLATIRKRDISAVIVFQNFAQMKALYGDEWETIITNCDTKIMLGVGINEDARFFSQIAGIATVKVESERRGPFQSVLSKGDRNVSVGKRELLPVSELMGYLGRDDMVVFASSYPPIWLKKYPHSDNDQSMQLHPIRVKDVPEQNTTARTQYNQRRDLICRHYRETHGAEYDFDRTYSWIDQGKKAPRTVDEIDAEKKMTKKKAEEKKRKSEGSISYQTIINDLKERGIAYQPLAKFDSVTGKPIAYKESYEKAEYERALEAFYRSYGSKENAYDHLRKVEEQKKQDELSEYDKLIKQQEREIADRLKREGTLEASHIAHSGDVKQETENASNKPKKAKTKNNQQIQKQNKKTTPESGATDPHEKTPLQEIPPENTGVEPDSQEETARMAIKEDDTEKKTKKETVKQEEEDAGGPEEIPNQLGGGIVEDALKAVTGIKEPENVKKEQSEKSKAEANYSGSGKSVEKVKEIKTARPERKSPGKSRNNNDHRLALPGVKNPVKEEPKFTSGDSLSKDAQMGLFGRKK